MRFVHGRAHMPQDSSKFEPRVINTYKTSTSKRMNRWGMIKVINDLTGRIYR